MTKVLLYYRYLGGTLGGGEYLPLAFASELQKTCQVTLALDWTENFENAVKTLGVDIDFSRLRLVKLANGSYHKTASGFESLCRFWRLRRIAAKSDVCISLANIMDFGRPAHHFIFTLDFGDPSFDEYVQNLPAPSWIQRFKRLVGNKLVRPMLGMRPKKAIITDPRMRIYPNSIYVHSLVKRFYGNFMGEVFYPPTLFAPSLKDVVRDKLKVVYLGRISPSKRIKDIIDIVEKARAVSGRELTLSVAGPLCDRKFLDELTSMAATRPWLDFPGGKYGEDKERFLLGATYAIHAMRIEAFGISVTEYLKTGLIPLVPDEGGALEVIDRPTLTYHTNDDAAKTLSHLVNDAQFRKAEQAYCLERAKAFSLDAYRKSQSNLISRILQNGN